MFITLNVKRLYGCTKPGKYEVMYLCVSGIYLMPLSTISLLDLDTVPIACYFLFFYYITSHLHASNSLLFNDVGLLKQL